jgi:hypothetical protein
MGASAAAVIIIRREKDIVAHFESAGATDAARAIPPVEGRLGKRLAWRRLLARRVIREATPGSYYLDEAAWVALSHMRRRVATVFMVLALIGFLWFLSRPPQ